jgi:hypothetical protein
VFEAPAHILGVTKQIGIVIVIDLGGRQHVPLNPLWS